jgi:hypothetical protein
MFDEEDPHPLSRIVSAIVAVVYVGVAFAADGVGAGVRVFTFCLLPLACIWFPHAMGDYVGSTIFERITAPSPAFLVFLLGWVVLLLPVLVLPFLWYATLSLTR